MENLRKKCGKKGKEIWANFRANCARAYWWSPVLSSFLIITFPRKCGRVVIVILTLLHWVLPSLPPVCLRLTYPLSRLRRSTYHPHTCNCKHSHMGLGLEYDVFTLVPRRLVEPTLSTFLMEGLGHGRRLGTTWIKEGRRMARWRRHSPLTKLFFSSRPIQRHVNK